jgi:VCBS repeat-containing protein
MKTKYFVFAVIGILLILTGLVPASSTSARAPQVAVVFVDDDFDPSTPGWGVDHFATIQEGVNAVDPGGAVNVAAGTYTEQVVITKDLSLLGAGQSDTFIQAFASMPNCFTTSSDNHPVVCVVGADATIDGFTIDGLGLGNSNYKFEGVAFRNAGGTLQNSSILNISDTPFSGVQHGVAVYVFNEDEIERTIHVLDNTINGFQKNAMALNAGDTTPLSVDVQRNAVVGAGITTVTAQNGIQVWADLGTGLVADNYIEGIAYDGGSWVATSILNFYADVDIMGNTVGAGHVGIYNIDGAGLIADNTLTIIEASGYAYGIVATDPPQAVTSPFAAPGKLAGAKGVQATLDVEVTNNSVTFGGLDRTGSVGIEADAGYGVDDLNVDIHHNRVSYFDYGLLFYQGLDSSGVFTGLSAASNDLNENWVGIYLGGPIDVSPVIHHNRVYGDPAISLGVFSELTATITAENNWFGCNEGPADLSCLGTEGLVDADPWLVLSAVAEPAEIPPLGASLVTADLIFNSDGADTSTDGFVPDGILTFFSAPDGGEFDPTDGATLNGVVTTTFTAPVDFGDYQVCTEVDSEQLCIIVAVVNTPPVAEDDVYDTDEDTMLVVATPGVLANDTDAEDDPLTAVLVSDVTSGTLVLDASGAFTYTPDVDFFGVVSFTYLANDGLDDSNIATVTITVNPVNDLPVAEDDVYNAVEDTPLVITDTGVLSNDLDNDGDPLTAVLVTDVSNGVLELDASGAFTYTPDLDYNGVDSFTYVANDGAADSNFATVVITVTNVNDLPVAVDDFFTLDEDTTITVTAPGVLVNDYDMDGDDLSVGLIVNVSHGTLTPLGGGGFIYTPDADFNGSDSFRYRLNDGQGFSNVAIVTLTVNPENEAPVAVGDAYTMTEDTLLSIAAPGVLLNDTDVDGDVLTATLVTDVSNGVLVLNADGSFTYTPDANFFGTETFTYLANDGTDDSNVVTVTITVLDVPDEPETQYFFLPMVYKFKP